MFPFCKWAFRLTYTTFPSTDIFALLCFTLLHVADSGFCFKTKGLWKPCVEQVYWCHFFPTVFAHFKSLCHNLVIHVMNFYITIRLLWQCLIFDITVVHCFGVPWTSAHMRWWTEFINVVCGLTAPPTTVTPSFPFFLDLPSPWDVTILKLGQLKLYSDF